jgi:hypothetical protein
VHYPSDTTAGRRVAQAAFPLMLRCSRIAGTPGPDLNGDGVPDNRLALIAGQPVYDNGWLGLARGEWAPRI